MQTAGKFILSLIGHFRPIEDDTDELGLKWNLETDYGVALDHIGAVFNIARGSLNDENYRALISTEISVNTSLGTISDLQRVLKIITNAEKVKILNMGNGLFDIELYEGDTVYNLSALRRIASAGTMIRHIYLVDDFTFTFDEDDLGFDEGELAENLI